MPGCPSGATQHPVPDERRPPNQGPKAAARNRAALVAAAREVHAEHGLDAPLFAIARRAGVGQGSAAAFRELLKRRRENSMDELPQARTRTQA